MEEKNNEEINMMEILMREIAKNQVDSPDRKSKIDLLAALIKTRDKEKELAVASDDAKLRMEAEKKKALWQCVGTILASIIGVAGGFAVERFRGLNNLRLSRELMAFEKDGLTITSDSKMILNKQIHG